MVKINLTFSLNHNFLVLCKSGVAPGCLLGGGGQNVSLLVREPKQIVPGLKKSLSRGGEIFIPVPLRIPATLLATLSYFNYHMGMTSLSPI